MWIRWRFPVTALSLWASLWLLFSLQAHGGATPRVAVLDFTNGSTERELDPLGKGLSAMLITDLSQASGLQLVERQRLSDIKAELGLAKSGLMDPKSAAQIGKLLGATHLVAGTFSVSGKTLRVDFRLFSVQSGDILLTNKSQGDKEAFFEVEKDVAQRLLAQIGLKLAPKERAALSTIHTADFEAFRSFGNGLALFDDKKYEEALAALRRASQIDANFKLAALTLHDYERILEELQTKSLTLQQAQAEFDKAQGSQDALLLKKLWELAENPAAAARHDRLIALYLLLAAYKGKTGHVALQLESLSEAHMDGFARERMGDLLAARFWQEVRAAGDGALLVTRTRYSCRSPNISLQRFSEQFNEYKSCFPINPSQVSKKDLNGHEFASTLLTDFDLFPRWLRLDQLGRLTFFRQVIDLVGRWRFDERFVHPLLMRLANEAQASLALDISTAALQESLRHVRPQEMQKKLAEVSERVELNATLTKLLSGPQAAAVRTFWLRCPLKLLRALSRAYAYHSREPGPQLPPDEDSQVKDLILYGMSSAPAGHQAYTKEILTWTKRVHSKYSKLSMSDLIVRLTQDYTCDSEFEYIASDSVDHPGLALGYSHAVLFGSHPLWRLEIPAPEGNPFNGFSPLVYGYDDDAWRASELHFPDDDRAIPELTILDGVPRSELALRFSVARKHVGQPASGIGVAFGLRNVSRSTQPLHGYALTFTDQAVVLRELEWVGFGGSAATAAQASSERETVPYRQKTLAEQAVSLPDKTIQVAFSADAQKLRMELNGKAYEFPVPTPMAKGFYGLYLKKPAGVDRHKSHVVISQLSVAPATVSGR